MVNFWTWYENLSLDEKKFYKMHILKATGVTPATFKMWIYRQSISRPNMTLIYDYFLDKFGMEFDFRNPQDIKDTAV